MWFSLFPHLLREFFVHEYLIWLKIVMTHFFALIPPSLAYRECYNIITLSMELFSHIRTYIMVSSVYNFEFHPIELLSHPVDSS